MAMRGWSAALGTAGALALLGATDAAEARGGSAAGSVGGIHGGHGGGFVGAQGWGGRGSAFGGHRQPHGFGHAHRHLGHYHHHRLGHRGRSGGFYGGGLSYAYGGYGSGGYDPGTVRSPSQPPVGILPSPVLPPAIYVIGDKPSRVTSRQVRVVRKGHASGGLVADSHEARGGSSAVVTPRSPDRRHRVN